jgi:endonuclease/exonuclease/phosphatase family metal-dependent hydrolase
VPIFAEHGMHEVATLLGEPARTFPAFSPALALDKMFVRDMQPVELVQPAQETAWLSDHLPYIARLRVNGA